jgi:death on curing protein
LQLPQNKFHYETPDLAAFAAIYAYGIARDHPFDDGNKRTALVAAWTFLLLNRYQITASKEDRANLFITIAACNLSEVKIAE